jgi:ABC-2 type transport system permease protein
MNSLYWSVRRELWENRSIYVAPLIAACFVLVAFPITLFKLPARVSAALVTSPDNLHQLIEQPYVITAIIIMGVELVVALFYCLDALYGERRDRSVLFWKSMPVSDLTTVLAKLSIPVLVLPLVAWAVTVATQSVMLAASSVVLRANGIDPSILSAHLSLSDISRIHFSHLVVYHGIWCAPLYAWLLLASAWATRLPFLWATLPPVAIVVIERVAFNSALFVRLLQRYFFGAPDAASSGMHVMTMESLMTPLGDLLLGPGPWVGLVLSAVFVFGAVRLRRVRGAM